MVSLPPKDEASGCEARVLLAECRSPASSKYVLADATTCMQYMDKVLWNRLDSPAQFGAKGAKVLADVVRAPGQFAGFQNYPNYDASIVNRIQAAINIANDAKDKRHSAYTDHINAAIAVAKEASIAEPSPGTLAGWRTAGSSAPGGSFKFWKAFFGNDFYYIQLMPIVAGIWSLCNKQAAPDMRCDDAITRRPIIAPSDFSVLWCISSVPGLGQYFPDSAYHKKSASLRGAG